MTKKQSNISINIELDTNNIPEKYNGKLVMDSKS